MDVKKIEKCEKLTQICINMLELLRLYKILKIKKSILEDGGLSHICKIIYTILKPLHLQYPSTTKWISIANEYEKRWNFPNCLGAVDGKHIEIRKPINSGSRFYNYKKFNSIVLIASCDAKSRFIWFNLGDYGKNYYILQ